MNFDPNGPDKLHAEGWGVKQPTGWGVWLFLGACALVAVALVYFIR